MRMLSTPVMGAAALVTSPALYQGLVLETIAIDIALIRYFIALMVCWVALSTVEMLVGEPPRPKPAQAQPDTPADAL